MHIKLLLLLIAVVGTFSPAVAQNDSISPYKLRIKEGKPGNDADGDYLKVPVTLINTDNDTLYYTNWLCSWHELYTVDNLALRVESVPCDKNFLISHALAPNDSTTVQLKLYNRFGQILVGTAYKVGFDLIKIPDMKSPLSIKERRSHQQNYIWSNTVVQQNATYPQKKKSWINPWENVNAYRFAGGYLKDLEAEASYLVTSYPERDPGYGGFAMLVQYAGAGIEYIKDGPRNAVGAKLSYEVNYSLFSAQLGTDYLYSEAGNQARIMPKAGLSMFGIFTLYYGMNFNLMKDSALQPSKHILTLQFNIYDIFIDELKHK